MTTQMNTPSTSAPLPRLLEYHPFDIKPKQVNGCIEFTVYWDGEPFATDTDLQKAIDTAVEDFKDRSRPLLNRLKDPEIKITFSIR